MKFLSLSLFLNIGLKISNFSEIFLIGSSRIEFIYVKIFSYEISMYTIDTRDFICLIVIPIRRMFSRSTGSYSITPRVTRILDRFTTVTALSYSRLRKQFIVCHVKPLALLPL